MSLQPQKHILFIMQLPPPIHGVSVMNQLVRDSVLLNQSFQCDYINLTTARSIDDLGKSRLSKYRSSFSIVLKAIGFMRRKKYKAVYITIFPYGLAFLKDSLVVMIARLFGQKPILHLHVSGFKPQADKSIFHTWYYRFVFKNTEVICLSELLTSDISSFYKGKIHILPNGINQVNFENSYPSQQNPVSILYLSNLIREKGILVLLDALQILMQRKVPFNARIVGAEGDISYRFLKDYIAARGLEKHIALIGPKYHEDKFDEFRQAGLFVFPSVCDTFGLVLLEAMQFGVPCISTPVGGIPDVLGDGSGLIINQVNAGALADAMETLIMDPEKRNAISRKGFERFKTNYTTDIFEARLKHILDNAFPATRENSTNA